VFRVQANKTAVVCFVSDPSLIEKLEPYPAEVDAIFTHPLRGVLEGKVDGEDAAGLSEKGGEWWPFEEEFHVRFSCLLC
jgi:coenzyme A diphosphatase NUDT7